MRDETKRGIKLTIIDQHDYEDYREVCNAIIKCGYKAIVVDNGNTVFQKDKHRKQEESFEKVGCNG